MCVLSLQEYLELGKPYVSVCCFYCVKITTLDVVLMCPLQNCFLNIHNLLCMFLKDSDLPHYWTVYVCVLCMMLVTRWLIVTKMCVNVFSLRCGRYPYKDHVI